MSESKEINILAIESSCDETAASVVKNGRTVLSNVINTQIAFLLRLICTNYTVVLFRKLHPENILRRLIR